MYPSTQYLPYTSVSGSIALELNEVSSKALHVCVFFLEFFEIELDLKGANKVVARSASFQHMYAIQYAFYNPDHVRNYLFRENVEPKPKDFLSKFLNGQD